jgi:hypothetical protein
MLDGTSTLTSDPLEMGAPCLCTANLLPATARPAKFCFGIDIALGNLIPPLLLPRRPDLLGAAAGTLERLIGVVSPFNEPRHTITVVRGESARVDPHQTGGGSFDATSPLTGLLPTNHVCLVPPDD